MTLQRALLIYGVVFLLALPLTFPVSLIAGFITLPSGVASSPLEGSLWSLRLDWIQFGSQRVRNISVRPSLAGLFTGVPLKLSLTDPVAVSMKVGSRDGGAVVRKLKANTQLDVLRELLAIPPLGFDAAITLLVDEAIVQGGGQCQTLSGSMTLAGFEGNIEGLSQLKELTADLSCEAGRVVLKVNPDNSLRLSGSASFSSDGHYLVNMLAEPPPGPIFETFVDLFGQPRDGRRFQLNFRS